MEFHYLQDSAVVLNIRMKKDVDSCKWTLICTGEKLTLFASTPLQLPGMLKGLERTTDILRIDSIIITIIIVVLFVNMGICS